MADGGWDGEEEVEYVYNSFGVTEGEWDWDTAYAVYFGLIAGPQNVFETEERNSAVLLPESTKTLTEEPSGVNTSKAGSELLIPASSPIVLPAPPPERVSRIRINELAREIEVAAYLILEALPELGFTATVTNCSSITETVADQVREHFGMPRRS